MSQQQATRNNNSAPYQRRPSGSMEQKPLRQSSGPTPQAELQSSQLNTAFAHSRRGQFYEKAKSRRSRVKLALELNGELDKAVPLGTRSKKPRRVFEDQSLDERVAQLGEQRARKIAICNIEQTRKALRRVVSNENGLQKKAALVPTSAPVVGRRPGAMQRRVVSNGRQDNMEESSSQTKQSSTVVRASSDTHPKTLKKRKAPPAAFRRVSGQSRGPKRMKWHSWSTVLSVWILVVWISWIDPGSKGVMASSVSETQQEQQCTASSQDPTCQQPQPQSTADTFTQYGSFELLQQVPHDAQSFTQGLELYNATHMYEAAGLYQQSSVRLVEIATGRVVRETKLADEYFAEGLSLCHGSSSSSSSSQEEHQEDELVVLTWREKVAFCLDPHTLAIRSQFSYETTNGQGWGLACTNDNDDDNNIRYVTDGTSFLHTWNAEGRELDKIQVTAHLPNGDGPKPVSQLNELEWDASTSTLLANVWYQDVLIRIQPDTGFVTTVYDLSSLNPREHRGPQEDCLNGIAQEAPGIYWVTGKLWPSMYKIRLIEPAASTT